MSQDVKDIIKQAVEQNYEDVAKVAKELYEEPETANNEFNSCKIIMDLLREKGFDVEDNYAGVPTGFKASKKNGEGPKIAVFAEYDALPGIGHACGHHLIAGMSLLAGIALSEILDEYEGEVAIFGTPAEETGEGKPPMAEQGCFDDYDMAMMMHPNSINCIAPIVTSIGVYDITFKGKTAHCGANPFDGVNALDAVVSMYNGVSMMRQQMKDGTRIAGIILSGGEMTNSIPDDCTIRYEIRTLTMDYYDHVRDRLEKCAESAAIATGCKVDFKLSMPVCASMDTSKTLAVAFKEIMMDSGITDFISDPEPIATDLGDVSQIIPTIQPFVKVSHGGEKLHSKEFLEATDDPYAWEKMKDYSYMLALLGLRVFEDKEMLKELRQEREAMRNKKG